MSSTDADVVLPIAGGASLRLHVPSGAIAEPAGRLPVVDVMNLPGVSVRARVGFFADDATLRAVCATAPSNGWAPGVEDLVLGRASQIAKGVLGGDVTWFEAHDSSVVGGRFEQRFDAVLQRTGEPSAARGRHLLGFASNGEEGIVCTVICVEREDRHACETLVDAATPVGRWASAPAPSTLVRGIFLAAHRPTLAAGILGAMALALVAFVIARRPRPRAVVRGF